MTDYSLPRRLTVLALLIFALGASACATIASPEGWSSPVLSDQLLLVAHEDELLALDAESLDPRWLFPSDGNDDVDPVALYGTPQVADGTVFVPAYDGKLYALDAASGEERWQPFETEGPLIGGVAVSQDTVYFGSSDGKVYAVDVETGEQRWSFKTAAEVWSTPTLVGDTLYVTSLDRRLYALDADGNERWSFKTAAGVASPAVVYEEAGLVYVGGFDSRLRAIDLETQEERWSVNADNWFWTRPLVVKGVVYAGSLDGKVYAVDAETGERRWSRPFETKAPVRAGPVMAGGALVVVDRDGNVYKLDLERGTGAGGPLDLGADVLADPLLLPGGELAVVTTDGELALVDPDGLDVVERKRLTEG